MLAATTEATNPKRRSVARSLTELYKNFEIAQRAMAVAITGKPNIDPDTPEDRAVEKAHDAAERVVAARALTIDEMLLKIRAALWIGNSSSGPLEEIDSYKPGRLSNPEVQALVSLRGDLLHLCREGS